MANVRLFRTVTNAHVQFVPRAPFTVVFSCPGQEEQRQRRPAAGTTGKNLELLLEALREKTGRPYFERRFICIANAWDRIEFKAKTGRTEARKSEIASKRNLVRLSWDIGSGSILLVSGRKAQLAISLLRPDSEEKCILFVPHLGGRGLLRVSGKSAASTISTQRRIEILASWIVRHLDKKGIHQFPTK